MSEHDNVKERIIRSLEEHTHENGLLDINKLVYEMHGVLAENPSEDIEKIKKDK